MLLLVIKSDKYSVREAYASIEDLLHWVGAPLSYMNLSVDLPKENPSRFVL